MHECLSGERPVKGSNLGQVAKAITTGAISSLKDASVELPPDVVDVVATCLSLEATARPHLDQIEEVLRRHTDGAAARARSIAGATTTSPLALPQTLLAPDTRRSRQRAAAALVSIAVVAIGMYFSWPVPGPKAPPALSVAQIPETIGTPVAAAEAEPSAEPRQLGRVDAGARRAQSAPAAQKGRDPVPKKKKAKEDRNLPQAEVTFAPKLQAPEPSPKAPVGKYSFLPVTTPP